MSSTQSLYESPSLQHLQRSTPAPSFGRNSTIVAYGILVIISIYYLLQYLDYTIPPMSELLWTSLVYITPNRLVARLDNTFKDSMAEEAENHHTGFDSKGHTSKSNAMRRFLGLDVSGLLTTVQRTRTLSNLSSVFKAVTPTPKTTLPGLGNWDNSCYQNSVLQGLAALESLNAFLNEPAPSDVSQPTKTALKELVAKLNDPENVGKTFWTPADLKSMSSWQQQDAQEYFSKVSDELEKDALKVAKAKPGKLGLEGLSIIERAETPSCSSDGIATPKSSEADSLRRANVGQLPEELKSLIVRNPLEGLLAQRVGCQQCGYVEGLSLVPFNCLTVPLGRQWMYDIRTCLDEYTALEPINGVECTKCTLLRAKQQMEQILCQLHPKLGDPVTASEDTSRTLLDPLQQRLKLVNKALVEEDFSDQVLKKCQLPARSRVSTTKSRQAVVARAPRCLVIHVNRSNFDELTGVQSKNTASVRFPQQLDLAPWCLGHGPGSDDKNDDVEQWNVDPSKSMLSDSEDLENLDSGKKYELRAVVTHYGRHENGHYICYRKAPYTIEKDHDQADESHGSWWRLSDDDVDEVSEETVLAQGGVFMLFYEQMACVTAPNEHQPDVDPEDMRSNTANEATSTNLVDEASDLGKDLPFATLPEEQTDTAAYPTPPMSPSSPKAEPSDKTITPSNPSEPPSTTESSETITPPSSEQLQDAAPVPPESTAPTPALTTSPSSTPLPTPSKPTDSRTEPANHPSQNSPQPVSPASMRTAAPRSGKGSVSRAGKRMGSVAGFVQAN
ncbi:hypothetical protein JMJ35_009624 [Cladonia borealis]|uniref:ubiquitinyl hydrolase 1 n=1 Tax=Cladonia borealis TaxID=184061 RepID=A0AA39V6A6_9LECA|nr:hypothetical protein JMJ35_009624 [Cladonia borealis]